ncbi:hypothetical protein K504DRAFT_468116 [Pleomassaria siparia CBS 279.74]|uniref:SUN domain-containing protein n=1 Tax=Pleomassaria siparia CBS 279.74 TaxID=1314801 RepID=A0A6G1K8X4_9PLEO|nr:hypothetical protein K504DRAFT_468116 [Pleomassaria siparia CBS 279.74]
MDTPNTRRSLRRAPSTVAVSAVSATTTTRRKAALPKAKGRQSQAYGSGSRAKAAQELTMPTTGFSQAFGEKLDDAVTRDVEEHAVTRDVEENEGGEIDHHTYEDTLEPGSSHLHNTEGTAKWSPPAWRKEYMRRQAAEKQAADQRAAEQVDRHSLTPTPSNADDSKSFGGMRESGMLGGFHRMSSYRQEDDHYSVWGDEQFLRQSVHGHRESVNGVTNEQVRNARSVNRVPDRQIHNEVAEDQVPHFLPTHWRQVLQHILRAIFDYAVYFYRGFMSHLPWAFVSCVLVLLIFTSLGISPRTTPTSGVDPNGTSFIRDRLSAAISSRIKHENERLVKWISPPQSEEEKLDNFDACKHFDIECDEYGKPAMKYSYMTDRMFRLENAYKKYKEERLKEQTDYQNIKASIRRFEDQLPTDVVSKRDKDGNIEIPDELWQAISSRILSGNSTPEMDNFLAKNEAKIAALVKGEYQRNAKGIQSFVKEEVMEAMEQHYLKHHARVDNTFAEIKKTMKAEIAVAVKEQTRLEFLDRIRIQSLAVTNMVANAEVNLRKVNYFSTGLSAHVDPDLTSATNRLSNAFFARAYQSVVGVPAPHPPTVALQPWDEAGDCWCAAVDRTLKTGRAQIAVVLGHPVLPRQVTVEHLPKDASPGRAVPNAPKGMELWVQTAEELPPGSCLGDGPKGYVCLGSFEYDINGSNHIQTFDLEVASGAHPVTRAVVRVVSNWGGDYSCLYRVRLHGESPAVAGEVEED